jgi:hypothetical protein
LRVFSKKEMSGAVDIQFDFDLNVDSTADVASEMRECEELAVIDIETNSIVEAIGPIIDHAKKHFHQIDRISSSSSRLTVAELAVRDILFSPEYGSKPYFSALRVKEDATRRSMNKRDLYSNSSVVSAAVSPASPPLADDVPHTITNQHAIKSCSSLTTVIDEKHQSLLDSTSADVTGPFDEEYQREYQRLLIRYNEAVVK